MAEDERTRRWQRVPPPPIARDASADPLHALRGAIAGVRSAPHDDEARRRLRALAADQSAWEQLALLLADEARASVERPEVAAAFYEELADVHENLDQPLETIAAMEGVVALAPGSVSHHDRLAWLYRRAGATLKAAETFERVAMLAHDDRARAALRAAGKLYREAGKLDQAVAVFRQIVMRKASDTEAWRSLEEILAELQRWREVAEVRGILAEKTTGIDKAVLLRAQARALEQAGDTGTAADLVAVAAQHAPDDVSGLVDYATVLAREGRTSEAADVLSQRIQESVSDGAPAANIAALRMRLVETLDASGDNVAALAQLDKLLADKPDYAPARERLVESARRQRASGDLRGAITTFERAHDLAVDDDAFTSSFTADLTEARDVLGLQRQLEAADKLAAGGRLQAAIDHLRATLDSAPPDTQPDQLARLVLRTAQLTRELGDADEAHQLLHDAHRLARRDLQITLALGESCFGRKLWREAAIHLGSLADHPDAPNHAAVVALGLAKAGQAEVRALKPANALKHYEAAVRIDPTCGLAWHQLAELATGANDMARAADCLEHEAAATTDSATRVRLYDALGDLCLTVLSDAARAERCWSAIASEGNTSALDKLLALQRKRGAQLERGETCERLAALSDAKRAKELTEEAAEAFAAAGDMSRARAVVEYLIAKYPLDVDTVVCASAIASPGSAGVRSAVGGGAESFTRDDHEATAAWLRRALGAWDAAHDRGEGDPRRAELWRRLGDAEKSRAQERAALEAYQRAVVTAPESDAALAARRGLIDLASSLGRRANTSRLELIEAEQNPADIIATARELAASAAGKPELAASARAMFELARALGIELRGEDEQFLDANAPRPMASDEAYAAALDDAERRALTDDPADGPLGELLALVGESLPLIAPDAKSALDNAALSDARRATAGSDAAALVTFPQIAKALGGPPTMLYTSPDRSPTARPGSARPRSSTESAPEVVDIRLLLAQPPVVVLGPRIANLRARSRSDIEVDIDTELRFRLGRIIELVRPHRLLAAGVDKVTFVRFVAALVRAFGKQTGAEVTREVARESERLRDALPVAARRKITERLATLSADALDAHAYLAACERAADRSGLVACGHPGYAIHLAGGLDRGRHLVELAASQRFGASQRKLRRR